MHDRSLAIATISRSATAILPTEALLKLAGRTAFDDIQDIFLHIQGFLLQPRHIDRRLSGEMGVMAAVDGMGDQGEVVGA